MKRLFLILAILLLPVWASGQTFINGNCDTALQGWGTSGAATASIRSGTGRTGGGGNYSWLTLLGATDGGSSQGVTEMVVGNAYLVTAWVKGVNLTAGSFYVTLGTVGITTPFSNGTWVKLEFVRIVPATDLDVTIGVTGNNDTLAFYMDDISIVQVAVGSLGGSVSGGFK